jgi:spore coat polysaccharide biosynthesis predicted glycosyltransferase SpsG
MAESDLCIGAAGGTSLERCYLGLPTMLLVLADNQLPGAKALEKTGAVVALKGAQDIPQVFENYFAHETAVQLKRMSEAAAVLSDGLGVQRIVDSMRSEEHHA